MDAVIAGAQLEVFNSFAGDHALERVAGSGRQFGALQFVSGGTRRAQRAQMHDQRAHFVVTKRECRHTASRNAGTDEGRKFSVTVAGDARENAGCELAAIAVGAVTFGAAFFKESSSG